jgi:hypothetical protein
MAQVKLSPQIIDIAGSIGEHTFSRVQSGIAIKSKPHPNRNALLAPSSSQILYRSYFSQVQRTWITLSQDQMIAWHNVAPKATFINKLGDKYKGDGYHFFLRCNQNRLIIGETIILDPPSITDVSQLNTFSIFATGSGKIVIQITFSGFTTDKHTAHIIYCSRPLSPGIFYCKNSYRIIGIIPPSTSNDVDITLLYLAVFNQITTGKKIFCQLLPINTMSGIQGYYIRSNTIIL